MRATRSRILACAVALGLGVGLSACGARGHVSEIADSEGFYVEAGHVTYQVQLSRQLNPYDVEDRGYLAGLPKGITRPAPDELWFVVFLWAKNQTRTDQTTSDSFDITDTQGNVYTPIALNARVNPYAWTSQVLKPLSTEPLPGTTASFGPTQGKELLFKMNDAVYSNRPLTLEIHAPGQPNPSQVSLDL